MLKHFRIVYAALLIAVGAGAGLCDWAVAAEPARPASDEAQGTIHTAKASVGFGSSSACSASS